MNNYYCYRLTTHYNQNNNNNNMHLLLFNFSAFAAIQQQASFVGFGDVVQRQIYGGNTINKYYALSRMSRAYNPCC